MASKFKKINIIFYLLFNIILFYKLFFNKFQISNTCTYFSNVLWPEFNLWEFLNAIFYYQRCYSDIQKIIKIQNVKPKIQNSRQLTYIDKLHHKRQIALQRICLSNF